MMRRKDLVNLAGELKPVPVRKFMTNVALFKGVNNAYPILKDSGRLIIKLRDTPVPLSQSRLYRVNGRMHSNIDAIQEIVGNVYDVAYHIGAEPQADGGVSIIKHYAVIERKRRNA